MGKIEEYMDAQQVEGAFQLHTLYHLLVMPHWGGCVSKYVTSYLGLPFSMTTCPSFSFNCGRHTEKVQKTQGQIPHRFSDGQTDLQHNGNMAMIKVGS